MIENQSIQPARASRSLPVLLLVCAGALLIIAFTWAGAIQDTHFAQITRSFSTATLSNARGPEADPYMRHASGYDAELELPPEMVP